MEYELNLVLVEPQIPQNTGNIARTCAVTGARLHLVKPLGFVLDDKHLKRAGLDYWDALDVTIYDNLEEFFSKNPGPFFYFTTKEPTATPTRTIPNRSIWYSAGKTPDCRKSCWRLTPGKRCGCPCAPVFAV